MYQFSKPVIKILDFARSANIRLGLTTPLYTTKLPPFENVLEGQAAGDAIATLIADGKPAMIGRFGVGELNATLRYATMKYHRFNWLKYITAGGEAGWWTKDFFDGMPVYNGFFPATEKNISLFAEMMLQDMQQLDILGSWQTGERVFASELKHVTKITLDGLEPYFHERPYTQHFEGKKILVIHPFQESIINQYNRRALLFKNQGMLPDFDLKTIKAVQSLAGGNGGFNNWFDALEYMKAQMDVIDFDVAVIGCGAYGFPLAAYAKRLGKIGLHMGGATQLMFGIKGKRWEERPEFQSLFNEYWIKPTVAEKPSKAELVEDACYW